MPVICVCLKGSLVNWRTLPILELYACLIGAVHYGRNGHNVASLMHVDHTLPMWAFFDVYGSVQKIKLLGKIAKQI